MHQEKTLAARLREERQRLGLSAREMAEIGGVSRASQSLYEADKRVPDARYLTAAEEHGIDVRYLLTGERTSTLVVRRFNWALHDEVYLAIDQWLSDQRLTLPPGKKLQILKILFEHLREREGEGEGLDQNIIADLFRLVA